jgi:hypothetical protein
MTALPDLTATICALEVVQPLVPKLLLGLGGGDGGHEREVDGDR